MKNFKNRKDAGTQLAQKLADFQDAPDTVVLGAVRGGVIVAAEVARALNLPLGYALVRKIGAPHNREIGVGVLTNFGDVILNERNMRRFSLQPEDLAEIIAEERQELRQRQAKFRFPQPPIEGKTLLVIDDGIATGVTFKGIILSLQQENPAKIILATPIAHPKGIQYLESDVAEIITVLAPEDFNDVEDFYEDFGDCTDAEVKACFSV
jgi:predicted phosphoribosyltransferase